MTSKTKSARSNRTKQNEDIARIQAAWQASVPAARAKEFNAAVEAMRARGPLQPQPDQPKGTRPNPPRPGHEPKPKADPNRSKKRY
jgi:hypothetical protein